MRVWHFHFVTKHAVQNEIARERLVNRSTAECTRAQKRCILTSNWAPLDDPAFLCLITPLQTDERSEAEIEFFVSALLQIFHECELL